MSASNKFVSLHGANRNKNFGDVLLMDIYKTWIEESGFSIQMDMANSYYASYLKIQPRLSAMENVKESFCLIYGGGGYFGEPSRPTMRWYAKFVMHHMWPGILFRIFKKPYAVIGAGFGPLSNRLVRMIAMFVLNGAKLVSVRDEESGEFLKQYGYKKHFYVVPDSALSIANAKQRSDAEGYRKNRNHNLDSFRVAFHIPVDPGPDHEKYKNAVAGLIGKIFSASSISNIVDKNMEFYFLVDHGVGEQSYQYRFYEKLNEESGFNFPVVKFENPKKTLEFIGTCDVVLTTKLHVAITSYALAVKPIGVSKHHKTNRFFRQVDLSNLHFEMDDIFDSDKTDRIVSNIFNDVEVTPCTDIIDKSLKNRDLLFGFIQKAQNRLKK